MANIINDLGGTKFPHKNYTQYSFNRGYGGRYGEYYDDYYGDWTDSTPQEDDEILSGPVTHQERVELQKIHGDFISEIDDKDIISWFGDDLKDIRCTIEEESDESYNYSIVNDVFHYGDHRIYIPKTIKCTCGGTATKQGDDLEFICQSCGELVMDEYTMMDYLDAKDEKNKPIQKNW